MSNLKEIKIGNGSVFAAIDYDKGGYNYFSSSIRKRGYSVIVQNRCNEFMAFEGLDKPSGAARMFIEEANRFNKKKLESLEAELEYYVEQVMKESASAGKLPIVFADYEKIVI